MIYDLVLNNMKILLIEDEKDLSSLMKKGLEENSFSVDVAFDGDDGLSMAQSYSYDAVVLDIMLPGMDGFTVLGKLRSDRITIPVLVLTVRGAVEDRVKGLNAGADDYLLKPFDFTELLARLRAIIRRNKGESSSCISIDDLTIDINSRTVRRGGRTIHLTAREYTIMEYLVLNRGRVITRDALAELIYDVDHSHESNVIDVYINFLRNKIDRSSPTKLIHTVRGAGYILK